MAHAIVPVVHLLQLVQCELIRTGLPGRQHEVEGRDQPVHLPLPQDVVAFLVTCGGPMMLHGFVVPSLEGQLEHVWHGEQSLCQLLHSDHAHWDATCSSMPHDDIDVVLSAIMAMFSKMGGALAGPGLPSCHHLVHKCNVCCIPSSAPKPWGRIWLCLRLGCASPAVARLIASLSAEAGHQCGLAGRSLGKHLSLSLFCSSARTAATSCFSVGNDARMSPMLCTEALKHIDKNMRPQGLVSCLQPRSLSLSPDPL